MKMKELPDGASKLLALVRAAHYERDEELERAAAEKLMLRYGFRISFPCRESVDEEIAKYGKEADDA